MAARLCFLECLRKATEGWAWILPWPGAAVTSGTAELLRWGEAFLGGAAFVLFTPADVSQVSGSSVSSPVRLASTV